jgi:hypothetical protein
MSEIEFNLVADNFKKFSYLNKCARILWESEVVLYKKNVNKVSLYA